MNAPSERTEEFADKALDRAGGRDGVCISCDRSAHE